MWHKSNHIVNKKVWGDYCWPCKLTRGLWVPPLLQWKAGPHRSSRRQLRSVSLSPPSNESPGLDPQTAGTACWCVSPSNWWDKRTSALTSNVKYCYYTIHNLYNMCCVAEKSITILLKFCIVFSSLLQWLNVYVIITYLKLQPMCLGPWIGYRLCLFFCCLTHATIYCYTT